MLVPSKPDIMAHPPTQAPALCALEWVRSNTTRGFNWARKKLMWTNFEALPRTKYFLQF